MDPNSLSLTSQKKETKKSNGWLKAVPKVAHGFTHMGEREKEDQSTPLTKYVMHSDLAQ